MSYVEWRDALADAVGGLELVGAWVDSGIGAYEYWGHRGVDTRMEFELSGKEEVVEIQWDEEVGRPGEPVDHKVALTTSICSDMGDCVEVEVTASLLRLEMERAGGVFKHSASFTVS